ncbi:MAG: sugar phosphate isomerase/epimerase family protein [Halobacteriaceae archaeon]
MPIHQGLMLGRSDSLPASLDVAARQGFDYVELNMETGFARDRLDPDRVATLTDDRDLDVVAHLPYRIDPCTPHDHARDGACRELEAAIDAAADAGAHRGIIHGTTFTYGDAWDTERIRDLIVSVADRLATYGADRGVDIAVENLKGEYYDVHTYAEIADRSSASLCLDTGHAAVSGMSAVDQGTFLADHGDAVSHIHLNDTRHLDDDEHLPVGLGTLDFDALATALVETDWSGTATHEVWAPTGPGPVATAGKQVFEDALETARTHHNGNIL